MSGPGGQSRWPGACRVGEIDETRGSVMAHPWHRSCPSAWPHCLAPPSNHHPARTLPSNPY